MEFFESAAGWGRSRAVRVVMENDILTGWHAVMIFHDANGQYTGRLGQFSKKSDETHDEYDDRVREKMGKAAVAAHKRRQMKIAA